MSEDEEEQGHREALSYTVKRQEPSQEESLNHGLPWGDSPVDLSDDADPGHRPKGGLGWASGALLVSTLALLAFNSHALSNWADQLPVSPATAPLVNGAHGWHDRAGRMGLNLIVDKVEQTANAMRDTGWTSRSSQGSTTPPAAVPVAPSPSPSSSPASAETMRHGMKVKIQSYLRVASRNDLDALARLYADPVDFYGTMRSRDFIMHYKRSYFARWPKRTFHLQDQSFTATCSAPDHCRVSAVVDWTTSNPATDQRKTGVSRMEFSFSKGLVTAESIKLLSRQ